MAHPSLAPLPTDGWTVDATGALRDPEGELWTGDEDPPGVDVRNLPLSGLSVPLTLPAAAPARGRTGQGGRASPQPSPGILAGSGLFPLPPCRPDTAWRVERDVPCRTLSPNKVVNEHFRARAFRRNSEHKLVLEALRGAELPSGPGVVVTLTRVGPRLLDDGDNLGMSLKSVRDCIAGLLGVDDGPGGGVAWRYEQRRHVERELHHFRAVGARPAKGDTPAREYRPARDGWRYVASVRVCIEAGWELAGGPREVRCDDARTWDASVGVPVGPLAPVRVTRPAPAPKPEPRAAPVMRFAAPPRPAPIVFATLLPREDDFG